MDDANVFGKYDPIIQVERGRDLMYLEGRLDDSVAARRGRRAISSLTTRRLG
jgi:hypothetical protein